MHLWCRWYTLSELVIGMILMEWGFHWMASSVKCWLNLNPNIGTPSILNWKDLFSVDDSWYCSTSKQIISHQGPLRGEPQTHKFSSRRNRPNNFICNQRKPNNSFTDQIIVSSEGAPIVMISWDLSGDLRFWAFIPIYKDFLFDWQWH